MCFIYDIFLKRGKNMKINLNKTVAVVFHEEGFNGW